MKVLVTGGRGFIGSNLAPRLKSAGHSVVVLDNLSIGTWYARDCDVEFIHGDIRDQVLVRNALRRVDAVVHLAADTRVIDSIQQPAFNFDVNVTGTFLLLQAMKDTGVPKLVHASTAGAIAGNTTGSISEESPVRPISPYGASKAAAEAYCFAYSGSYGMKTVSLRFANVYGPRSVHKQSVVATFMKRIIGKKDIFVRGDGLAQRDFIYVDDICEGVVSALEADVTGVFQLGSGSPTSINELTKLIRQTVKTSVECHYCPPTPGEVQSTYCDIRKAWNILHWTPKTSLLTGLAETWKWFQRA